jgi:hypothetical protein
MSAGGEGQIQGHDRGLEVLAGDKLILEGLLVHQMLNFIILHLSPILNFPLGAPCVPFPKGKELEAGYRQLGDLVAKCCHRVS